MQGMNLAGPLYLDSAAAERALADARAEMFHPLAHDLLCSGCGYPSCGCTKCLGGSGPHSCWLAGSAKGKGKRPRKVPPETPEQLAKRAAAWADFGFTTIPTYSGGLWQFP